MTHGIYNMDNTHIRNTNTKTKQKQNETKRRILKESHIKLWNAITLPKHSHNKTKPNLKNQIAKSQNRKLHELNEQVPSVSGVNQ
eukprot:COSAG06_NODE_26200_length_619_cov_3.447075_1_plen_84_part_10